MSDKQEEPPTSTLRSSQRDKKAPTFYGNPISHQQPRAYSSRSKGASSMSYTTLQHDKSTTGVVARPKSHTGTIATSARSSKSSSALRKAEIDTNTVVEVAEMERQYREKRRRCEEAKKNLESVLGYISRCQINLDDPKCPEANKPHYIKTIPEKQAEVLDLECEIHKLESYLMDAEKEIEARTTTLKIVADLEKQRIDDEEQQEKSQADRLSYVEEFVNNSRSQNELGDLGEDKNSLSAQVLNKKIQPEIPPPTASSDQKSPYDDFVAKLAEAINGNVPGNSNPVPAPRSSSDKILARTVQGKDLPYFNGHVEEWPAFFAAFKNTTLNCQYTNADNLPRLQKSLRGEAKKTVQCLLINPEGVPQAMKMLEMRFGRPAIIIETLIQQARQIPTVKVDKPEMYISFGIAVNNLVSMVQTLEKTEHLMNPTLLQELVSKLPLSNQMEWMRSGVGESPNLAEFSKWLFGLTEAAFKLCPAQVTESSMVTVRAEQFKNKRRNERTMVTNEKQSDHKSNNKNYNNKTNSNSTGAKPKCFVCNDADHRPRDCPVFKAKSVDERYALAKEKKACYGCLNRGHNFNECKTRRQCGVDGCTKQHLRLLHSTKPKPKEDDRSNPEKKQQVKVTQETPSSPESESCQKSQEICHKTQAQQTINYYVLPVLAKKADGTLVPLYVALDNYSSLTAISEETAKYLGLTGTKKPFTVDGFQSTTTVHNSMIVNLDIESTSRNFKYTLKGVKTVPKLDLPSQSMTKEVLQRYKHLKGLKLKPYDNITPTILLGLDNPDLHIPLQVKSGRPGEPHAVKTFLGWMVAGRFPKLKGYHDHAFKMTESHEDPLHTMVKHFFTTEAVGVEPNMQQPRSTEDTRAQAIMDATIKRVSDGWESGLLWKEDDVDLPDSKEYAMKRLLGMERKMDKDPDFAKQYVDRINEYIEKGFARVLTPEEASIKTNKTFYLSHFMALNEKKPNKLRHVFDAAAKVKGRSLNDHLLQGPDKMASLVGILLQFRQRAIAVTADIKDFFHRVKVRKEDSCALRFLWREMRRDVEPQTLEMGVLIFGATCSPTCAQEAKAKNAMEFMKNYPKACEAILYQMYVDDFLNCCDTEEEAIQMRKDVSEILQEGSFHLCNWLSNSSKVIDSIPEDLRSKSLKGVEFNEDFIERVLGMFWRPESDDFTFRLKFLKAKEDVLNGEKIPTKREVLSLVMSIFDPLGVISILTVKAKMILQATWRAKLAWEDEIPRSTFELWKQWLEELKNIQTFHIPRCYSLNFSTADNIQLHIFCDGGEEAFGAVAYFRIRKGDKIETSLIMAKSNVAPLKPLSIPRIELQASLLASRMSVFIKEHIKLPIHRIIFWSDSEIVLGWIRADGRKYQQFVGTRIGTIQVLTDVIQWRWVPTNENVADEITRFAKPCDWSPTSRWINGPSFLKQDESTWPKQKNFQEPELETKPAQVYSTHEKKPLIDTAKISSWWKLVRVAAYVNRFLNNTKKKTLEKGSLSFMEIVKARKTLIKIMQAESFPEELKTLKKSEPIPKNSKLWKASPILQEELMLVKGRLDNAGCLLQMTKRPIIMDSRHPYGRLIIDHFHQVCGHHGHERIANELRQEYFVIGLRTAVKGAQIRCQQCKNKRAVVNPPEMGQLPKFRLDSQVRAFMQTGLDYFGPIEVIVKRSREKRYVALFTCLATRAVHLELTCSLSTDSCIMALRRFISRRGCPVSIFSDNGTNFVGANAELKKALEEINQDEMKWKCTTKGIQWHFNPPSAPHMGGSWERMVKAVKVALGDALQLKNLREEVLLTLLAEAEYTVNCHPLTYVSLDPNDEEALTPNHFLIGAASQEVPLGDFKKDELFGKKQWRIAQAMANHFWNRWVKEYLPTLLRRQKWCATTKPIKVGDVVIEVNNNLPRNCWPKGRVVKVFPGQDGVIRVVDIMLANRHTYRRPVAKLCILDVQDPDEEKKTSIVNKL